MTQELATLKKHFFSHHWSENIRPSWNRQIHLSSQEQSKQVQDQDNQEIRLHYMVPSKAQIIVQVWHQYPIQSQQRSQRKHSHLHMYKPVYLPGLGSVDGKGTTGWVVFGLSLHAAGIAAMIGLCQAKAAQYFSTSYRTNENTRDNLETVLRNFLKCCVQTQKNVFLSHQVGVSTSPSGPLCRKH